MSRTAHLHVGDTPGIIGTRVIDAWHRAERDELTAQNAELHIGFATWESMVRTLSPKRLALLRHVHQHPVKSVRALAQSLGRDYHRVHEDVEALAAAGLLDRDAHGLRADDDAFEVTMKVAL